MISCAVDFLHTEVCFEMFWIYWIPWCFSHLAQDRRTDKKHILVESLKFQRENSAQILYFFTHLALVRFLFGLALTSHFCCSHLQHGGSKVAWCLLQPRAMSPKAAQAVLMVPTSKLHPWLNRQMQSFGWILCSVPVGMPNVRHGQRQAGAMWVWLQEIWHVINGPKWQHSEMRLHSSRAICSWSASLDVRMLCSDIGQLPTHLHTHSKDPWNLLFVWQLLRIKTILHECLVNH